MIITCPKCRTKYRLKDDTAATRVRCKKCQTVIEIKPAGEKQRAEMKTGVPPTPGQETGATQQVEMKTVVPAGESQAQQRAEMKTAVPPAAEQGTTAQRRAPMETAVTAPARPAPGVQPEPSAGDPLIGKTLGGYEILRKLGEGGMGAVYEARQIALDRSVALKVLPAHLAANRDFITRFSREALSVAKLNHANIVQIFDIGKSEGTYFFSMEFVRGTDIGDRIEKEGKLDPATAVGYILQAARGLEYAHRKNIIHRDIKPDNIMINDEDIAKVADLGLAKQVEAEELSVTMSGVGMGTPVYMSPEQGSDAKHVDHRADIYSLGCTLYHMITGRIPYEGDSAYEIITKHVNEPLTLPHVIDPDISEELSQVIDRMLSKKKEDRYQSMGEVIEALEGYLGVDFAKAGFEPNESQINALKEHAGIVEAIQGSTLSKLAGLIVGAAVVLCVILAVATASPKFGVGVLLYAAASLACYVFLLGSRRKTYLYRRVRKFIFGNKLSDWITIFVVLVAAAVSIVLLAPGALAGLVLGLATGSALFFGVKRPLLVKRDAVVEEVKKLAREIRRKGIPDESINLFVCRNGGRYGELLCEEMAGYDAVVATRAQRSQEEIEREKRPFSVSVREWLIHRLDAAEKKREEARKVPPAPAEAAEKTAVMDSTAQAAAAAEEAYIAEVIEEKKPGVGKGPSSKTVRSCSGGNSFSSRRPSSSPASRARRRCLRALRSRVSSPGRWPSTPARQTLSSSSQSSSWGKVRWRATSRPFYWPAPSSSSSPSSARFFNILIERLNH